MEAAGYVGKDHGQALYGSKQKYTQGNNHHQQQQQQQQQHQQQQQQQLYYPQNTYTEYEQAAQKIVAEEKESKAKRPQFPGLERFILSDKMGE